MRPIESGPQSDVCLDATPRFESFCTTWANYKSSCKRMHGSVASDATTGNDFITYHKNVGRRSIYWQQFVWLRCCSRSKKELCILVR